MPGGSKGRVVKIDPSHPESEEIRRAARIIDSGGIVAFPTETFYGLGADPFNAAAVERLFRVKERDPSKPISLVVDEIKRLEGIVETIGPAATRLIRKFWPGPLTIVFKSSSRLPAVLTGGTGKIGVRIPGHPMALRLLRAVGKPLTATSANLSGQADAVTAAAVETALGPRIDLILDGGTTPGGLGSTVVDATFHPPRLIREGRIPYREVLQEIGLSPTEDHEW
ncbi:MAG TPA: L-threonylcarbamoyladenylate synthase [Nitrospiria bacterium]